MGRRDPITALGGLVEYLHALRLRGLRVAVELDRRGRLRKLHSAEMHQITDHPHAAALAFEQIRDVAGGVAMSRNGADTGREFGTVLERAELSGFDVRIERLVCVLEALLLIPGRRCQIFRLQPVARFQPARPYDRIRERALALM